MVFGSIVGADYYLLLYITIYYYVLLCPPRRSGIIPSCHFCHFDFFVHPTNHVRRTDFIENGDQSLPIPSTRLVCNCFIDVPYSYCLRRAAVLLRRVLPGHVRQVFVVGCRLRYIPVRSF